MAGVSSNMFQDGDDDLFSNIPESLFCQHSSIPSNKPGKSSLSFRTESGSSDERIPGPIGYLRMPKPKTDTRDETCVQQVNKEAGLKVANLVTEDEKAKNQKKKKDHAKEKIFGNDTPWTSLLRITGLGDKTRDKFFAVYNFKIIMKHTYKLLGQAGRIPFLFGIVKGKSFSSQTDTTSKTNKTSYMTLADPYGEINVVVDSKFVDAFNKFLTAGSAVLLQNCSIVGFKSQLMLAARTASIILIARKTGVDAKDFDMSVPLIRSETIKNDTSLYQFQELSPDFFQVCTNYFEDIKTLVGSNKCSGEGFTETVKCGSFSSDDDDQLFTEIG